MVNKKGSCRRGACPSRRSVRQLKSNVMRIRIAPLCLPQRRRLLCDYMQHNIIMVNNSRTAEALHEAPGAAHSKSFSMLCSSTSPIRGCKCSAHPPGAPTGGSCPHSGLRGVFQSREAPLSTPLSKTKTLRRNSGVSLFCLFVYRSSRK